MALIFQDTFSGSSQNLENHTPDTGSSWTRVSTLSTTSVSLTTTGSGTLDGGNGGSSDVVTYVAEVSGSYVDNYEVRATMIDPDSNDDPHHLIARYVDDSNMYILAFNEDFFELWKIDAGSETLIGSDQGAVVSSNDVVKLRVEGSSIKTYVNTTLHHDVTDSTHSSGKAGYAMGALIYSGDDISKQETDDFEVDALQSSPSMSPSTADDTETTDTTPSLDFVGTDDDGDDIRYQIQIDTAESFDSQAGSPLLDKDSSTDSGFENVTTPADTSPFNSGDTIRFTVQSGDALSRDTYYWRVRGIDPSGSNSWGDWSTARAVHIYESDQEISAGDVSDTLPTTSAHPYSSGNGVTAFTDTQYTNVSTDNATRVDVTASSVYRPYVLQKKKLSDNPFSVTTNVQVNKESSETIPKVASDSQWAVDASSLSQSFTVASNSNRVLMVAVMIWDNTAVSSISYGGNALTKEGHSNTSSNRTEWWYLVDPPTGSNTLSITLGSAQRFVASAIDVYDASQDTNPIDTSNGQTATGTQDYSINLTTTSNNCLLLDAVEIDGSNERQTPDSGQTELWDMDGQSFHGCAGSEKDAVSAGTHSIGWTNNVTFGSDIVQRAVAIKPASVTPSIKLDLWNDTTSAWVNQVEETNPTANTDFDMDVTKSSGYSDFIDSNGWIIARIVADYASDVSLDVDEFVIALSSATYTTTHTTDALLFKEQSKTHTTDAYALQIQTISHTTDVFTTGDNAVSHSTDALLKVTQTVSHSTDALLVKEQSTSHTTDALKQTSETKTHTTDTKIVEYIFGEWSATWSWTITSPTVEHTTDALLRDEFSLSHDTDALLQQVVTSQHTTDALKQVESTQSHTTDALIRKEQENMHSTDSLLQVAFSTSHSTDALLVKAFTVAHSTDSYIKRAQTASHTTDSLFSKTQTTTHSTDALLKKTQTKTHTTDSILQTTEQTQHTTDALLRKADTLSHSTDSFLKKAFSLAHLTDALLRKALTVAHTVDSYLQSFRTLSHTTDASLRKALTTDHSTDALIQDSFEASHQTDSYLRKAFTASHTTDATLRKALTVNHTTDALMSKAFSVSHSTDALLKKAFEASHTTDSGLRAPGEVAHNTDSYLRKTFTSDHSTDSLLKKAFTYQHSTDSLLQITDQSQHTTDTILRRTQQAEHTTDALIRKAFELSHSTDALIQKPQETSHTTDAIKQGESESQHTTDTLIQKTFSLDHTTDTYLRISVEKSHTTDAYCARTQEVSHTTDSYIARTFRADHSTDSLILRRVVRRRRVRLRSKRRNARMKSSRRATSLRRTVKKTRLKQSKNKETKL